MDVTIQAYVTYLRAVVYIWIHSYRITIILAFVIWTSLIQIKVLRSFCWPMKPSDYVRLPSETLIRGRTTHMTHASIIITRNIKEAYTGDQVQQTVTDLYSIRPRWTTTLITVTNRITSWPSVRSRGSVRISRSPYSVKASWSRPENKIKAKIKITF